MVDAPGETKNKLVHICVAFRVTQMEEAAFCGFGCCKLNLRKSKYRFRTIAIKILKWMIRDKKEIFYTFCLVLDKN
jgi:hypothetical protein